MANGGTALPRALAAAGVKWICANVDVVAAMLVLVREPGHIPVLQSLLQAHDSLHGGRAILSPQQDGYRLFRGKATSEEAGGDLTHSGTSLRVRSCGPKH